MDSFSTGIAHFLRFNVTADSCKQACGQCLRMSFMSPGPAVFCARESPKRGWDSFAARISPYHLPGRTIQRGARQVYARSIPFAVLIPLWWLCQSLRTQEQDRKVCGSGYCIPLCRGKTMPICNQWLQRPSRSADCWRLDPGVWRRCIYRVVWKGICGVFEWKASFPHCRDLHCLDELRFLIQRFFEQSASENQHLLCYTLLLTNHQ